MVWEKLEVTLDEELKKYPRALETLNFLRKDRQVNRFLDMSNCVTVTRMGYNDHGRIHARIAALNAIRACKILNKKKIKLNLEKEIGRATFEDSLIVSMTASFLHDIGNSILRKDHELWGGILIREIANRLFSEDKEIEERKRLMVMEGVICHMGHYTPTSIESKIVALSDGCDMEKGRARVAYQVGKKDIHSLSALGVDRIRLKAGRKKPIQVEATLNSSSGIFQVEEILIKKLKGVKFEDYVEIKAFISSRNETISYIDY